MGKKLTVELNQKFGDWTVIDANTYIKFGHSYCKCQCKCGHIQDLCVSDLYHGRTSACRSCAARKRSRDIKIGDKYKSWTVIDGPISSEHQCIQWKVQCECGNTRWVQGNELMDPNKCFECKACAQKKRGLRDKIKNGMIGELDKTRYTKLKQSAKKRGYEFNMSIEDLWQLFQNQKQTCAITGDHIEHLNDASLDRIDSTKGYIKGNVQWVTKQANLSKHIMSMNELYEFCKKVLKHANQQLS